MSRTSNETVGVLLPSNNVVLRPELSSILGPIYSFAWRRIAVAGATTDDVKEMASSATAEAHNLISPAIDRYVYACVASTLASPPEWESAFTARLKALSGRQCLTAMSATIRAMSAIEGRRIALVTPYPPSLHALAVTYLHDHGFEVVSSAALDIRSLSEVGRCSPERLEAAALAALASDADLLCILATDLPTFGSIAQLEVTTGCPVVTTNLAIAWALLNDDGRPFSMTELGRSLANA